MALRYHVMDVMLGVIGYNGCITHWRTHPVMIKKHMAHRIKNHAGMSLKRFKRRMHVGWVISRVQHKRSYAHLLSLGQPL
jgi:hypothetical protein